MEGLDNDLRCPITLDFLDDPVRVPCCQKPFSRLALLQYIEHRAVCPSCRADLSNFDVATVQHDRVLAGLVESFKQMNGAAEALAPPPPHNWSGSINLVGPDIPIAELTLNIESSKFATKPSLFIPVVDRSGSMAGNPWRQVQASLVHIIGMTETNPMVKTVIIEYQSFAEVVPTNATAVRNLQAGGGTNFSAAFLKIKDVLAQYVYSEQQTAANSVSSVVIAFLTDGQSGGDRNALIRQFRDILADIWPSGPIAVHAIGFSGECDKVLLEGLRTENGTFRYAEPGESDDTLCHKLTSLFEVAAMSSVVPIKLRSHQMQFKDGDQFVSETTINFPINSNNCGEHHCWVKLNADDNNNRRNDDDNINNDNNRRNDDLLITLNSALDKDTRITVKRNPSNRLDRWISVCTDDIAVELLQLSQTPRNNVFDLWCALIQQKVEALMEHSSSEATVRLTYLSEQARELRRGNAINVGKISDLRFGSKFSNVVQPAKRVALPSQSGPAQIAASTIPAIGAAPAFVERSVMYSHNNDGKERNPLQCEIMRNFTLPFRNNNFSCLNAATIADVVHQDNDGNTALHLAAYCGQIDATRKIIAILNRNIDDQLICNNDGETPVTLAIKRRGFHRTLGVLLDAGYAVPGHRVKSLQRFAVDCRYTVTANILSSLSEDSSCVDESMTPEYIRFAFKRLTDAKKDINLTSFLRTCLAKCMVDLVTTLLEMGAEPTFDMFLDYCIPKKPDCPEVATYIEMAQMLLAKNPKYVHMCDATGEGALFKSCDRGNLPHVKLFLDLGAEVDHPSDLGNTPLWIACARRYPCIVDELLDRGADPNKVNFKGNPPMYSICQKGPRKIAERLLSFGADIQLINENGDTMILLCCRNGQPDVLSLFLNYVDSDFVNRKAHIDGFNALFASVEANRPECIRVLHEYGIDVNAQYTDRDNIILGGATPLHLAAYYGRLEAAQMLLQCGANKDAIDLVNGQTALHIAVIQGNASIITVLRNAGANPNIADLTGNVAAAYCRSPDMREILVNPALDVLMSFARGAFPKDEQASACAIVAKHSGIVGYLTPAKALDLTAADGSTPFMQAILYSNWPVAKVFADLGVNRNSTNLKNISCALYAHWINNPRIKALVPELTSVETNRLQSIRQSKGGAKVLFLGPPPAHPSATTSLQSCIGLRMNILFMPNNIAPASSSSALDLYIWNAKIQTFNVLAAGGNVDQQLDSLQIFTLALYTNNHSIFEQLHTAISSSQFSVPIIRERISLLCSALNTCQPFVGECFVGSPYINRKLYTIDSEVTFPAFLVASTMWRVATANVPEFSTKKREGVVFIIKSLSGRFISAFSQFQYDCEVCFRPYARFKVTKWYHGDIIALGKFLFFWLFFWLFFFSCLKHYQDKQISANTLLQLEPKRRDTGIKLSWAKIIITNQWK